MVLLLLVQTQRSHAVNHCSRKQGFSDFNTGTNYMRRLTKMETPIPQVGDEIWEFCISPKLPNSVDSSGLQIMHGFGKVVWELPCTGW